MNSIMNVEEIHRINKKIDMYIQLETINFREINDSLSRANSAYNTDNSSKLEEINDQLKNNFTIITKIVSDYKTVLERNAINYRSTTTTVKDKFNKLG